MLIVFKYGEDMFFLFTLILLGCSEHKESSYDHLAGTRLITCIQYEERGFGEDFDGCKVELQFYRPNEDLPESPEPVPEGECVYYAPDEIEQRPPFNEIGLDAGSSLLLRNDTRTIELVRFEHNGSVDYKMQDCNEETYPFGEVFDIVVQGSEDPEGIPAFELLDAVVINEAVFLSSSTGISENGVVGTDYTLGWTENAYSLDSQSILDVQVRRVTLENWLENGDIDILECTPIQDGLLIADDDLSLLIEQEMSSLNMEWNALGTPVDLPWGDGFMSYASFRMMGNIEWGESSEASLE